MLKWQGISWKENSIISIETRPGTFVLAQMLVSPYLNFFNLFRNDENWEQNQLEKADSLFCQAVTRQFLSKSTISKTLLKAHKSIEVPNKWIQPTAESRIVNVWENTPDEKEVVIIGNGGSLIEIKSFPESL